MDVLVVGAGEMGRWFGAVASSRAEVAFADAEPAVAEAAADTVGGRAVALTGEERFDAVCLAVPIPAVETAVEAHAHRAERALLDVTGVMADAVDAMAAAAPERERVSLHPLFGSGNEPGSVAVVPDAPGPVTDELLGAVAERGNELFETTPTEHDEAMETVQAAAHAAVLAYGLAADDVREQFHTSVSGPLTSLVDQVTDGEPRVYADIQAAFEGATDVAEAAERVAAADREAFAELYDAAGGGGGKGRSGSGTGSESGSGSGNESGSGSAEGPSDSGGG